jgi:hypothetical protein
MVVVVDPVSLIVAALAAGAVAGAQNTATEAVKDAYGGLKALVQRRLEGRPAAEMVLEQHEQDPAQWEKALEGELVKADAAADVEAVGAAQALMGLLDAAASQSDKYLVDVRGAQGVQVGDRNTQHNTFGSPSSTA